MRTDADAHEFDERAEQEPVADSAPIVPCLAVVYPRHMGQSFKLGIAPRTIGSGQHADIVLHDDRIAPVHCRVSLSDGEVLIEDLGSLAGTWIDDQRIRRGGLESGQLLRIGHFRFMLTYREATVREPPTAPPQEPGNDPVLGVYNRAWILRRAENVLEARADSPRPVTLAMLALDNLDRLHERWGFDVGDRVRRTLARLLDARLREKESIGLCGAEKFLMLLPEVGEDDAAMRLDALRRAVGLQQFDLDGVHSASLTLSVGFVTRPARQVESLERFLSQAERALYQARSQGGDRVCTLE